MYLIAAIRQLCCVQYSLPVFDRHRPFEPQIAQRLLSKRYAQPGVHSILFPAERVVFVFRVSWYVMISIERPASYSSTARVYNQVIVVVLGRLALLLLLIVVSCSVIMVRFLIFSYDMWRMLLFTLLIIAILVQYVLPIIDDVFEWVFDLINAAAFHV
jgi:hypothetical protein